MARFRFDQFSFDSDQKALFRGREPVRLTPRAFRLLELLILRTPKAVSKRDLLEHVSLGHLLGEVNLKTLVLEIRSALEERGGRPEVIRTVYGYGYAFMGELEEEQVSVPPKRLIPPQVAETKQDVPLDDVAKLRRDLRNEVFISYSHKDKRWVDRLRVHLTPLERAGVVRRWDDTMIEPGDKWRVAIKEALQRARVAVILISADFLASDFIAADELPPILKASEEDGAIILPLIVSPSQFQRTPQLSRFQAVNSPSKPLLKMKKVQQEETLVVLASRISDLLHD